MADTPTYDFSFINRDVSHQLETSKEIISVVERLKEVADATEDAALKAKIVQCIRDLLSISSKLTINADSTSAKAAITISSATSTSRY